MITKDIKYDNIENKSSELEQQNVINGPVDEIFAAADEQIKSQNKSAKVKKKKKKRKHHILRIILLTLVAIIIIIGISGYLGFRKMEEAFPEIKESLLIGWGESREEVEKIDDSTLTLDQYYRKRLILLFTVDDVDKMVNNIFDIKKYEKIFELDNNSELSIIPKDKRDKYKEIIAEYKEAVKAKEDFLTIWEQSREEIAKMDNSTLTLEQRYQKRLMLLFTIEDVDKMIGNLYDIKTCEELFNLNDFADLSIIPEDKRDKYDELIIEYKEAVKKQEEESKNNQPDITNGINDNAQQ